ncbi:alpha/beta hydrolase family protein [Kribbella albertanoniae]|uniref:Esterase family protein n=1 Tax=Kribbella albertanoniae TaxID=1266829 RepID=A0A4R4PRY0_9ACTN|nr:alpha/beta hydrolase family protein [Kribbella albertanoniae]TDC25062.1 esterase family protein [Kribbella albertanoniae]
MKRSWIGVLLLALLPLTPATAAPPSTGVAVPAVQEASAGAEVVGVTKVADRLTDLSVRSPALGNRVVKVRLLTPDGWNPADRRQHWPTFWLLAGCCGDYTAWSGTDIAKIDSLRKVLVVMPEAGWNGWYSNWWNHGAGGDPAWETFHTVELRHLLEKGWGASSNRVVAGLSMGGQGALLYAARHPGMFRAAAAYSGSAHPLLNTESVNRIMGFFGGQGGDPLRVWGDPVAQRHIWAAHDPYYLAHRLKSLPVYLSCGDGTAGPLDPPGKTDALEADFNRQNHALAAALTRAGAKHLTTNFYGPGTHTWAYWQRELHTSLPILLKALNLH